MPFQKNESLFRTLFDNAPFPLILLSLDGRILLENEADKNASGYHIGRATHDDLMNSLEKREKSIIMAAWDRLVAGEEDHFITEIPFKYRDGRRRWMEHHSLLIRDSEGAPNCILYIGVELTKRKELELRLKDSIVQLKQLKKQLERENIYLREEISLTHNFGNIIGKNKKFKKKLGDLQQVSSSNSNVLILGETGTGKELIARAIHSLGSRRKKPLVKVNCAVLQSNLIESELFGHEQGAFTGAVKRKIGRFELADGGTIFLDEIGELPLDLQAKLLRVLQEGEFERLGGSKTIKVSVRVLSATNRDLDQLRAEGQFRDDLFYRLNVLPVEVPPLRDRKDDIPLLVRHFIEKNNIKAEKDVKEISQETMDALMDYQWPGNIRELENVIERGVVLSTGPQLILGDWLKKTGSPPLVNEFLSLDEVQKNHILNALELTNGKIRGDNGAAELLGLNPSTLISRMKKLGISIRKRIVHSS